MFHSFEDLEVWKRACNLAVFVYECLKDSRDFGLKDQMQRAAVSVASNIAETSGLIVLSTDGSYSDVQR